MAQLLPPLTADRFHGRFRAPTTLAEYFEEEEDGTPSPPALEVLAGLRGALDEATRLGGVPKRLCEESERFHADFLASALLVLPFRRSDNAPLTCRLVRERVLERAERQRLDVGQPEPDFLRQLEHSRARRSANGGDAWEWRYLQSVRREPRLRAPTVS